MLRFFLFHNFKHFMRIRNNIMRGGNGKSIRRIITRVGRRKKSKRRLGRRKKSKRRVGGNNTNDILEIYPILKIYGFDKSEATNLSNNITNIIYKIVSSSKSEFIIKHIKDFSNNSSNSFTFKSEDSKIYPFFKIPNYKSEIKKIIIKSTEFICSYLTKILNETEVTTLNELD